jgi:hypothetical protein
MCNQTEGDAVLVQHNQVFRVTTREAVLVAVGAIVVSLLSLWFRYAAIENPAYGAACVTTLAAHPADVGCNLLLGLIPLFNNSFFGLLAVTAAFWALWRPRLLALTVALISAVIGLNLYNVGLSALAIALCVLVLARPASMDPPTAAPTP